MSEQFISYDKKGRAGILFQLVILHQGIYHAFPTRNF